MYQYEFNDRLSALVSKAEQIATFIKQEKIELDLTNQIMIVYFQDVTEICNMCADYFDLLCPELKSAIDEFCTKMLARKKNPEKFVAAVNRYMDISAGKEMSGKIEKKEKKEKKEKTEKKWVRQGGRLISI